MKVAFRFAQTNSGASVWVSNLVQALEGRGIECRQKNFQLYKYLSPVFNHQETDDEYDLLQTDIFGYKFKTKKALVVIEHHMVTDPVLNKYLSTPQKIYANFLNRYERKTLKAADCIICVSQYTQIGLKKLLGFNSEVIYNGIDINKFKPVEIKKEGKTVRLLFVGNLSKRKGVDLLPKIMDQLGEKFELHYTSGLSAKNIFNQKNMYPLGKLSETKLIEEYNKSDILLFPTRLEGFGYAVAEAMACGKPVVSTNCSSIPELVVDKRGGFLCKMDDVNDFVQKVKILGKDEKLRKKMGSFNRQKVLKNFSLEAMGEKYEELYKRLI